MTLITQRFKIYFRLVRADKPIGTLLLMWPMLIALWVAGDGLPNAKIVIIFILGCFLMRSSGCAINDFADRHFDGHVERTKARPLARKLIHPFEAVMVYCICALIAFALVLCTNIETVRLSVVGLALATLYPFLKRVTHGPQWFLGAAFAWAVPMSYMALNQSIPPHAWVLYASAVLWAFAYDTQYAMVDIIDDKKIGVKSTAIWLGSWTNVCIVLAQLAVCGLLVVYGYYANILGYGITLSILLGLGLILYQHKLVQTREPRNCFKAFLNNQWLGGLWFVGFLVDSLLQATI
jgi:4-hydroxybenzoate polyprenyltransferase